MGLVYYTNGHWEFPEQMGINKIGFIYVIKDLYLNKFYLGKKLYRGTGTRNAGLESNWKKYCSSSKELQLMIKERPKEEFKFICLEEYKTKGTLSYAETWSLCSVEAPTKSDWYNKLIPKVSWNVTEAITDRHKLRLHAAVSIGD